MASYYLNNEYAAIASNKLPKKEIFTTDEMSMYALHLEPGDELPSEIHPNATQFFHVIHGNGVATIGRKNIEITDRSMFYVPSGVNHHVVAGNRGLTMYTIYAPAEHESLSN